MPYHLHHFHLQEVSLIYFVNTLIIDKIGMVSSRMLDQIHLRLQAIRRYELPFGNLMFLLEKVSNCDNLVQRLLMPTALCGLYQHLSFFNENLRQF